MSTSNRRTAVVLDAHPLWAEACAQLLARLNIETVGTTTNPSEAVELVQEHLPDLMVAGLDFASGPDDAIAALRTSHELHPDLKTVALSSRDDAGLVEEAFAAGARVFCLKTSDSEDLRAAIRQVFALSIYFPGGRAVASVANDNGLSATPIPKLTRRELEILRLVAEGHSNSQLAKMLWVTEQTIKFHLSNIYRKLGVSNRTEASRWAQLHGLLSTATPERAAV
jgi:two-component system, NarL family, response regulator DevR